MLKLFIYFNIYFLFMKKFQTFSLLYILNIIYFSEFSFAAVWWSELEQSQANANIILSFFSTELLLNIIFACVTIVLTFLLSKIVTSRLTSYLEKSYAWEESGREELVWVL